MIPQAGGKRTRGSLRSGHGRGPLKLDASPETVATYGVGTNGWLNFEGAEGEGTAGGTDRLHVLSPTFRADFPDLFVASPTGGERLVGGTVTASPGLSRRRRASSRSDTSYSCRPTAGPASTVSSRTYPARREVLVVLPRIATTRARVRVLAREGTVGNALFGDSQINFTIAWNVGSGAEISFVSSERVDSTGPMQRPETSPRVERPDRDF